MSNLTDAFLGDEPGQEPGKKVERQRGMQSFLTWSFFLAQIAAAQNFIGSAAHAADADQASAKPHGDTPDAPASAPVAPEAIMALADPASAKSAEPVSAPMEAPPPVESAAAASPAAKAMGEPQEEEADAVSAGGSGGGSIDGSDHASLQAGSSDDASGLGLPLDTSIIALPDIADIDLGFTVNVSDWLGDTVGSTTGLVDDVLSAPAIGGVLATVDHVADLGTNLIGGLGTTLFGEAGDHNSQLLNFANLGSGSSLPDAVLSGDLLFAGNHYTDLAVSLSEPQAIQLDIAPAGSFLQSLPIIGDALGETHAGGGDHENIASFIDLTTEIAPVADHVGAAKGLGDIWS